MGYNVYELILSSYSFSLGGWRQIPLGGGFMEFDGSWQKIPPVVLLRALQWNEPRTKGENQREYGIIQTGLKHPRAFFLWLMEDHVNNFLNHHCLFYLLP